MFFGQRKFNIIIELFFLEYSFSKRNDKSSAVGLCQGSKPDGNKVKTIG